MGHGRQSGRLSSPSAFETSFGWVLAGNSDMIISAHIATHTSVVSGDDIIRRFGKLRNPQTLSSDEHAVVHYFKVNYRCNNEGRFIVPLPK